MTLFGKEEKKVEYLELVYDLIFVYIVSNERPASGSICTFFLLS